MPLRVTRILPFTAARRLTLAGLFFPIFTGSLVAASPDASFKVAIIGDSTVSEYQAADPHRGWGQVLPDFFTADVTFLNLAKSGASTKTFPPDRWQKILEFKPDFVLIEFGFNDQHPKTRPEATDAATEFKDNLRRYVNEARQATVTPVLVTPNHRRTFDPDNQPTRELEPYVAAMKEVAQELKVPLVDLYDRSNTLYESLGEEGSTALTINNTDNADRPGKGDRTHFTPAGAHEMARLVSEGLADLDPRFKADLKPNP